ncbi:hypothetical protein Dip518_000818 [Parelusimicrobium proximum]|uniref:hypothetical protein n=1 Tax=Parelusimicrobium proximum TaxID=3228953 RepID=UPI003D16F1D6
MKKINAVVVGIFAAVFLSNYASNFKVMGHREAKCRPETEREILDIESKLLAVEREIGLNP